ncbi:Cationic amino acid transporter 5 [Citrus sinensis]|uniref:Cationic amino acid transporter 5 n=1 Tax=Citrus sinensis TaxID=2711 RepID=A0ACB8NC45_CITSI|nr:Cationic amino acid transporter 5 [Citrus sinensis]
MGSTGEQGAEVQQRSYWRWSKQDFLPEESFQSWGNYKHALSQTHFRFMDRLISRSHDGNEICELRKQSENDMKRCLTWWDLTWFGFGAVIGAGIFVLTGQEAHKHAGPAIVLSYVASGVSAMLSVFCYTEFAIEIPVAGGIVGGAAVARAWTSYFTTLLNREPNSLRIHTNLREGYNLLDPIAVAVLATAATIASISTRKTSVLNWIASAINTVVILFVIIVGFAHADASNLKPFLPFGSEGIFKAAAVVYFAYGGFDNIATMAEETKNPSRDIPIGLLGSMSMITIIYCLMALSLCVMQPYTDIDPNAAYSVAFQRVGMKWAKYLVALGALKGMTTVLLVGALGNARYTTHIARAHMIPPWNISLLGVKAQWLGWICYHRSSLVLGNFGDISASASAENPKNMGSSSSSMASILVNCNKYLSHGISGLSSFCKIWNLHSCNAGLLFFLWPPCNI